MQITLIQSEIEQALKNYINEQVNIKDGMEIQIDLSATRGVDGFKATIDIVPKGNGAASASTTQSAAPAKAIAKPTVQTPAPVVSKNEPTVSLDSGDATLATIDAATAEAARVAAINARVVRAPVTTATPQIATQETEEVAANTPAAADAEEVAPAAPRTSLFAGLNKPKN